MRLEDFSFELPPELIAQKPAFPRDEARLLVYNRLSQEVQHSTVAQIAQFLPPQSTLVVNNSKVRQGRLYGKAGSKPIELLVLSQEKGNLYQCLLKGKKILPGSLLTFYQEEDRLNLVPLWGKVEGVRKTESMDLYQINFSCPQHPLETAFALYGHTPLPPYITKPEASAEQYQTVYARELGSAAAPTAGLHFTPQLIKELQKQGIGWKEITLHVGIGTFLPLRKENITENKLHQETTFISPVVAQDLNQASRADSCLTAVGTTSTRTLEAHYQHGEIEAGFLSTDLFIYPGYTFQTVNALLTNFHLPHSSLLLLVAAFLGNHPQQRKVILSPREMTAQLQFLYQLAIAERYRFYSFGDAMLIL